MKRVGRYLVVSCLTMSASVNAYAQEDAAAEDAPAPEASAEEAPAEEAPAEAAPAEPAPAPAAAPADGADGAAETSKGGADGMRFRFGIAGGAGILSTNGISLTYGGMDMRFGAQINDLIAVYAQPQMGYYSAKGIVVGGGLLGASVVADVTLLDRLFVGAGVGYAILNNPAGAELHFRAGGYPIMGRSKEKVRRKGLMLGADLRLHFVQGVTFVAPTFNLGYEAF